MPTCQYVPQPGGHIIVCREFTAAGGPARCDCGSEATKLCDYPVGEAGDTCSYPLCAQCRRPWPEHPDDFDLCPVHADWIDGGRS
jgi:hypothetical protein